MAIDETEPVRRELVAEINGAVVSDDKATERARLEAIHGKVYDTNEMSAEFEALGFGAPLIVVRRRSDGVKGSLFFQDRPRFYFGFEKHKS